ncbi:MAG TPA: cation diffusion facilitator family transporter [Methylocella sp.]|nr:cation diffusion facilitator family transporter [Methylocella sp.]
MLGFGLEAPVKAAAPAKPVGEARHHLKEKAALASVVLSSLLTFTKAVAGLASGSLAVLSEAAHNLADVAATLLTYFAIRLANKPADDEHQFGHAKIEALAALLETGFLFALATFIAIEAFSRLSAKIQIDASPIVFVVLIGSMMADLIRWLFLRKVAVSTKSDALAADALHFSSDIVASGLALCGILAVVHGYPQGDALAALGLSVFIGAAGWTVGKRTVSTLVDTAPKGLGNEIRALVQSVPGVIAINSMRLRPAGAQVFGDLAITVSRTLPLEEAAAIEAKVASAILARFPDVNITITTHPVPLNDETILERLLLIAAKRHVLVHHVTLQEIDGRTSIGFDIEVDGHMTQGSAHEIASGLEQAVREELGSEVEVDSHIEPMESQPVKGLPAAEEVRAEIAFALARMARKAGSLEDVHNVRVRNTREGLVVHYHCRVKPELSVAEVHDCVDELERKMREDPRIVRIIGHAEPLRR